MEQSRKGKKGAKGIFNPPEPQILAPSGDSFSWLPPEFKEAGQVRVAAMCMS